MNKKRFPVFDWMRSIAIFIVLIHHLPAYAASIFDLNNFGIPLNLSRLNNLNAYLGLGLFVFISGYLINSKKAVFDGARDIRSFFKHKFVRIFILYYFACIYFFASNSGYSPFEIAIHTLGLQLLAKAPGRAPMQTIWFVGLIVVYYTVFVLLKSTFLDRRFRIAIFLSLPILFAYLNQAFSLTDGRLFLYYPVFFCGVFCAENRLPKHQSWSRVSMLAGVGLIASLIGFFEGFQYISDVKDVASFLVRFGLLNVLMISFAICSYNACQWLSKRTTADFDARLKIFAYASYCMYLFHRPIFHLLQEVMASQFSLVRGNLLQLLLMLVVGFPLTFGASYLFQATYERLLQPQLSRLVRE